MRGAGWRTVFVVFALAIASPGARAADPQFASADGRTASPAANALAGLPFDELRRRANDNDLPAMEEIGRRLIQGVKAPKDPKAGAGWLLRAAELGSPHAAFSIGVMYERGFVVKRDPTRAAEWYRKGADGDVPMAKHNLALMLRDGKGVPRDGMAAAELMRSAARQGLTAAMFVLGDMYERGDAGSRDAAVALAWFSIASEYDRQANKGRETALVKAADRRSLALQDVLSGAELLHAQDVAQNEFRRIVEAMTPTAAAQPSSEPAAPAAVAAAVTEPAPPPSDEEVGWPKAAADQVRVTQQALVDLKLLRDKPDGLLGRLTRTAIRDFQQNAGLPTTGDPSKELYLALKVALRDVVEQSPLPTPPRAMAAELRTRAEPEPDATGTAPWPSERKDQIAAIQTLLTELRYYDAKVTGQLGTLTQAAIRDYQRAAGLRETGTPSRELFDSLSAASRQDKEPHRAAQAREQQSGPEPPPVIATLEPPPPPPPTSADIVRGEAAAWPSERTDQITAIQTLLTELRYYDAKVTGQLGTLTQAAIRDYQRAAGLRETGTPSRELFDSLQAALRGGKSSPEATPAESRIEAEIQRPAEGAEPHAEAWPSTRKEQITAIQNLLIELRYYDARATGQLGTLTQAAIRDYQRAAGLRVTGVPSRELFDSLTAKRGPATSPRRD